MQVEDFLADLRSVLIDREGQYGEAGKSFRRIARFWSMYLTERTGVKVTLSPMDVGQMMNLKGMLPEGFLQRRIVNFNYAVLANMIRQRRNHRLPQWHYFLNKVYYALPFLEILPPLTEEEGKE